MGMYTGFKFKGVIHPDYAHDIANIVACDIIHEFLWGDCENEIFRNFGELERSDYIPRIFNDADSPLAYDEKFNLSFDDETNELTFQCCLKNYNSEIDAFILMLPTIALSVEHCETRYEENTYSHLYVVDGDIVEYNSDSSDECFGYGYYKV